jgi:N-acetylmuramoyl-L-alanine amidase
MTVFISCGHNNARTSWYSVTRDNGAVWYLVTEYQVVRRVATQLQKTYAGKHKLSIVPEGLNLGERIKYINARAKTGDICIELHMNSGPAFASGNEVYYHWDYPSMAGKCNKISKSLEQSMWVIARGAKPDTATRFKRLWFCRDTRPIAYLIELGFITNMDDVDDVWVKGAAALTTVINTVL